MSPEWNQPSSNTSAGVLGSVVVAVEGRPTSIHDLADLAETDIPPFLGIDDANLEAGQGPPRSC